MSEEENNTQGNMNQVNKRTEDSEVSEWLSLRASRLHLDMQELMLCQSQVFSFMFPREVLQLLSRALDIPETEPTSGGKKYKGHSF